MNGSSAFLVDTNVLVYAYDPADREKQERAVRILEMLAANRMGSISTQILGEFFVTVTRKIAPPVSLDDAIRSVVHYTRSWLVHGIDGHVVLEAVEGLRRHHLAYWDSLVWATAKRNGVPNVLSENFQDGRLLEGIRFLNPLKDSFDLSLLRQ